MRVFFWAATMAVAMSTAAQALVVTAVDRMVRFTDTTPVNLVASNQSSALGTYAQFPSAGPGLTTAQQLSLVQASPSEIRIGFSPSQPTNPAGLAVRAADPIFAFAETWLQLDFIANDPGSVVSATFNARRQQISGNPTAELSLFDVTLGQYIFNLSVADITAAGWSWSGNLATGHAFHYFARAYANAAPGDNELVFYSGAHIVETPLPEGVPAPGAALLLLTGLGLIRRRA